MVFRKLMAAFGAGVEVDTVLTNTNVRPGESPRGVVHFRGGGSEYKVEGIYIDLTAVVEVESGDNEYKTTYSFLRQQVAGMFQLAAVARQPRVPCHARNVSTTAGPGRRGTGTGRPKGRAGESGSRSQDHTGHEKPE